jgi:hypothetical protein
MPCYSKFTDGGISFLCGQLGEHCASCSWVSEFLCDYPVGEGKTCDRPLCHTHANDIAPDIHYCPSHFLMWQGFVASGGVKRELENVVPFWNGKQQ